jgi:hypothetical protein
MKNQNSINPKNFILGNTKSFIFSPDLNEEELIENKDNQLIDVSFNSYEIKDSTNVKFLLDKLLLEDITFLKNIMALDFSNQKYLDNNLVNHILMYIIDNKNVFTNLQSISFSKCNIDITKLNYSLINNIIDIFPNIKINMLNTIAYDHAKRLDRIAYIEVIVSDITDQSFYNLILKKNNLLIDDNIYQAFEDNYLKYGPFCDELLR